MSWFLAWSSGFSRTVVDATLSVRSVVNLDRSSRCVSS